MFRIAFICGLVTAQFSMTAAADSPNEQSESDTVTIPLNQVWAYKMPGTRDLRKLNPSDKDLVGLIQQSLGRKISSDDAGPGFVVQGEVRDALQEAYAVLVAGKPADKKVNGNKKTWIVFFTRDSSQYVHLHRVQQGANQITVRYRFVPHDSKGLTRHFALVPLGSLPAGQYRVSTINSPMEQRYVDVGFQPTPESYVPKIVCRNFEFVVTESAGN